ncbi:MAG: L-aspartate oxidase [Desulfohalobiaceae bacterium]
MSNFNQTARMKTQVLVVGSGIAGCISALEMADQGVEVTLVTSGSNLDCGNTAQAQGGIVYRGKEDSAELLKKDILTAGWNSNYKKAVQFLSQHGPKAVQELLLDKYGVELEKDELGQYRLTREGGHGLPRILFAADCTGRVIMDRLIPEVKARQNINILTCRTAIDLLTSHHHSTRMEFHYQLANQCLGAYVFNQHTSQVEIVFADYTILATGGLGQIYLHTTNSRASIGSGLSMASRSGARVMNCEYVQFHPTALFQRGGQQFLISEAVRGEGARFVRQDGKPFMKEYDPRGDLAPRDVVTRAIVEEMLWSGDDFVYLDATRNFCEHPSHRFPNIYKRCKEAGIDMYKDAIPVVPAAHFFCGGVLVDLEGRTNLNRLYAVGECSCTGVHGANRLASTSLLEGLLWGKSVAKSITAKAKSKNALGKKLMHSVPDWSHPGNEQNEDPALIAQDWATIKHTMWNYVGIVRTTARLRRANEDLQNLNKRLYEFYRNTPISRPLIELFHGCQSAMIITLAALRNTKSLGCHFRKGK